MLAVSSKYYENGGLRLDQAIYKNFTIFSSDYLLYSRVTTVNLKYEVNYHLWLIYIFSEWFNLVIGSIFFCGVKICHQYIGLFFCYCVLRY